MPLETIGGYSKEVKDSNRDLSFTTTNIDSNSMRHITSREEINELIGNAPGWLLHSGISLIFFITLLLLVMSHMISYPNKIIATGVVTTEKPPIQMFAPRVVRIEQVLVENGSVVEIGEKLIRFNGTANEKHLEKLLVWTNNYEYDRIETPIPSQLLLGPLQPLYAQLQLVYNEYQQTRRQTGAQSQLETINQEIKNIARLKQSIQEEIISFNKERRLAQKELDRTKSLLDEGLISQQEYENTESKYNRLLRQSEGVNKSSIQNDINIDQLIFKSKIISEERHSTLLKYQFRINEILAQLNTAYLDWLDENYLHAEISGTLEYSTDITSQYTIQAGESIGYIIPDSKNNRKYAKALIPIEGIGNISADSRAIIKFDAYPYKQYGTIDVNTNKLSIIPQIIEGNNYYGIRLPLPSKFITNYNKHVPFKPEMGISVEIITESRSILERIIGQLAWI